MPALAAALAACGGDAGTARGCASIFFREGIADSRVADVRTDLEHGPFVRSVRSVSREKAVAYFREKYPEIANGLAPGPLPDTLYVTPRSVADLPRIRAELKRFGKVVDVVEVDAAPCPAGQ